MSQTMRLCCAAVSRNHLAGLELEQSSLWFRIGCLRVHKSSTVFQSFWQPAAVPLMYSKVCFSTLPHHDSLVQLWVESMYYS